LVTTWEFDSPPRHQFL